MKIVLLIVLYLHLLLLICGCERIRSKDQVKSFIPGIYVRHYVDEYTNSYDTIVIKLISVDGSEAYTVVKRSRFQKQTNEGKAADGEEFKNWAGFYDENTKTIWLEGQGKRIYFDPRMNELKIGTQPYKKLKL